MELLTGFALFRQHLAALTRKNVILTWRNKKSAILQVFSSLFFIFLIFCIDKAIKSRMTSTTTYKDVPHPKTIVNFQIPPCEDRFFTKLPCYDFVWSGEDYTNVGGIVRAIMDNNPGRMIPDDKVLSFKTPAEVDDWLAKNPMKCPGALHFEEMSPTVISYGIQTNSTPLAKRGNFEDPTFKFQIPLQLAAEREIARFLIGEPNFSWVVGLKEFAHPALDTFSTIAFSGPTFFLAIAMFGFVFQISSLVTEKELKLRQAMSIMGLYESAYWLSWLAWETLLTLFAAIFTVLFGMMFQFDFFLKNDFGLLFFVFFLFQLNMLGFAFMISTFIGKSSSATTVGFSIFIIGFMTQLVTTIGNIPYGSQFNNEGFRFVWSLFPPNLLAQSLKILGEATATSESEGMSWSMRGKCPSREPNCVITIEDIFKWLISTFFVWLFLAIYLDNILPNVNGVRKPVFYFLNPSYWTGKDGDKVEDGGICSCLSSTPPLEDVRPDDEDVLQEELSVKRQVTESDLDPNVSVQLRGLTKTYPGTTNIGSCKCKRTSPYHAVKGVWMNFEKNRLFCLLGPNGAGKTTIINCLTGITPVSNGDALIYGNSIRRTIGMSNIRRMIGVCPQFDILWNALSAQEHMHLFASIKGLLPSTIKSVAEKSLAEVKLTEAGKVRAGSYSGGMRRRLSVAIALIGDPKLVFLDEPTTGMDPITRRHVWDIIEEAKKDRAIILTTHSMEEADILGDRIAIMAKGKLRCIGTSIRLKSRFGTGYIANVSFLSSSPGQTANVNGDVDDANMGQIAQVKEFFKSHLGVGSKEENRGFLTFVIPHVKEGLLTKFFAELQDREKEFGISDIQLGLTTLEEVFLNIAKQAELESATAEGSMVTLNMTSGTSIEIPKGARFIAIPGTESKENPNGLMVEVFWEQDESGNLCISGHSPETPTPPHVQPTFNRVGPQRSLFGGNTLPIGFVIHPNETQQQ